jgi:hypothetical protein
LQTLVEPLHKARCVTLSSPETRVKAVGLLESCCSERVAAPGFFSGFFASSE